jgi:hypothetical protein
MAVITLAEIWILKTIVTRTYYVSGEGWVQDPSDYITAYSTEEEGIEAMKNWREREELLSPDERDSSIDYDGEFCEKSRTHFVSIKLVDSYDTPSEGEYVQVDIRQKLHGFKQRFKKPVNVTKC